MSQPEQGASSSDPAAPGAGADLIDALSSSVRENDPGLFTAAIADAVEQLLATFLSPALHSGSDSGPRFGADVLRFPRAFEEHLLGALGLRAAGGPLALEISSRVRRLAREHYEGLDSVRSRRAAVGGGRGMEALLRELSILAQPLGVDSIELALRLSGGLSGADAVLVWFSRGGQTSVGVLKLTHSLVEFDRERAGLESAESSWMSEWVVGPVAAVPAERCEELDVRYSLLLRLAFPQAQTDVTVPTLHESIGAGNRQASKRVVEAIGTAYARRFVARFSTSLPRTDAELLTDLMGHWPAASRDDLWEADWFWGLADLPSARTRSLTSGAPNPLFEIFNQRGVAAWKYVLEFQHGDLNPKNILLPADAAYSESPYRLIDFEKAASRSCWLDPCWLGLWLVQSGLERPAPQSDWDMLPPRFFEAMTTGGMRDGRTDFVPSLQLACAIGSAVAAAVDAVPADARTVLQPVLRRQFCLTLAAAALAMAFYEVRRLQLLDDQRSMEGERVVRHRQLAHFYFGVAGLALAEVRPRSPT